MGDSQTAGEGSEPKSEVRSLDPHDWPALREQAHRMLDDMLGFVERIRERPVWQPIPDAVRERFRGKMPSGPTPLGQVHEEFMRSILPYAAGNAHPGFMGWVQGGGTPVGMLAEMLAAGLNANVGGRDQIPLDVERQVTEWMRALFGFPLGASGLFVTGTSLANFLAVVVARDARLGTDVRGRGVREQPLKLTAYASVAAHRCIARALDLAGLGSDALRPVAVDGRQRISIHALAAAIVADRAAGCTPFLVIGTAGTVDTGAIDDLSALARLCAQEHLWFHVDGALGALAMLVPELVPRLDGVEQADSLAFDFHKWAQVPYDAGFLLVRDGLLHQQAFASSSAYLQREERGMSAGSPWPCDLGVDLSRGFRALKTWCTFKVYGADAIGAVIRHTCELARYLESRIAALPELEPMGTVELNIVCFRYRFAGPEEQANRLNRQMAIELQEAGHVAPSTTVLDGRVALRAAFVNHRSTRAEVDTLVEATLAHGRKLAVTLVEGEMMAKIEEKGWQRSLERVERLHRLDALLGVETLLPDEEIALRVDRATLLAEAGRSLEARSDHFRVLVLAPAHLPNLLGLGRLLVATGQRKAAQVVYTEAVKHHPGEIISRVNLGGVLLEGGDAASARIQYEAALEIDPEFPQAHGGMYYALSKLGEPAEEHRRRAFGQKNVFVSAYRGDAPPIPILLLVASNGGNAPIESLLDDRIFQTFVVVADFYDPHVPLPAHRLVVNGIGDADQSSAALAAAESLLRFTDAPVLNAPAAVRVTGRCENSCRLGNLPGVVTAKIESLPYASLATKDGAAVLARHGFTFPLLLRAPGEHTGKDFVRVETPGDLAAGLAQLPGADRPDARLLAMHVLDARGADGCFRKYRVMLVGGRLYPLHLAISDRWMVHYFSADMRDRADHRAEEACFLADMAAVLGAGAMAALRLVEKALGLDYAGIDFGLSPAGEVLLFEANATMVFSQPDEDPRWDYRRAAVDRIHSAFREMLHSRCLASASSRALVSTSGSTVLGEQSTWAAPGRSGL
jgi:glutamate/tyrosine decarboxylase-like PLP-dependent enzyme